MKITPDLSVRDLVEQLESRALADLKFADDLRSKAGMPARVQSVANSKKDVVAAGIAAISDFSIKNKKTLADNIQSVLAIEGKALSAADIRDRLHGVGIGVANKNLLPSIYTAMTRKEHIFVKRANGTWDLREKLNGKPDELEAFFEATS